ncbi:NUDIX hydrolase [Candidatus Poribacteria bacterium]|nr:NUDIX hydrolase [Candidatus Poribacteria bacterium]
MSASGTDSEPPTVRLRTRLLADNRRLALHEDFVRLPTGRETEHWRVEYKCDGVGVLPLLDDGRVLLGLHFRYCVGRWGWEIAAGGVPRAADHEAQARRELEEETGYRCRDLTFLFDYHPAPGLGDEHFFLYAARGLEKTGTELDADEIHELRPFAWHGIEDLLARGRLFDGFTLTALFLARARGWL